MVANASARITPYKAPPYEELVFRHKFAHLLSGKSTKTAGTRAAQVFSCSQPLVTPVCTKSFVCWSFAQDPTGGTYRLLAGFNGPYFYFSMTDI